MSRRAESRGGGGPRGGGSGGGESDPTPATPRRSPEQRRAADALGAVVAVQADAEIAGMYRSYAERLGPAIVMNGLGQALATERAAGGDAEQGEPRGRAHRRLYGSVQAWLCRQGGIYAGQRDVLAAIVEGGESEYLRAQGEVLAWLVWHKKFCRAYLPKLKEQEG